MYSWCLSLIEKLSQHILAVTCVKETKCWYMLDNCTVVHCQFRARIQFSDGYVYSYHSVFVLIEMDNGAKYEIIDSIWFVVIGSTL